MGPRVGSATKRVDMTTRRCGKQSSQHLPSSPHRISAGSVDNSQKHLWKQISPFPLKIKSSALEKQKAEWVSLCSLLLSGSLAGQALSLEEHFTTQSWPLYPRRQGMQNY